MASGGAVMAPTGVHTRLEAAFGCAVVYPSISGRNDAPRPFYGVTAKETPRRVVTQPSGAELARSGERLTRRRLVRSYVTTTDLKRGTRRSTPIEQAQIVSAITHMSASGRLSRQDA
jgi:hypothetical protein